MTSDIEAVSHFALRLTDDCPTLYIVPFNIFIKIGNVIIASAGMTLT